MANKAKTTEDLRTTLFDTLEKLTTGAIDTKDAAVVAKLADSIIKTADIELKHSIVMSRLDKDDQNIATGPLLLTQNHE